MSGEIWKSCQEAFAEAGVSDRTGYRWKAQKRLSTRVENGVCMVEVEALKALATQRADAKGLATAGTAAGNGGGSGSGGNGARDPGEVAADVFGLFEEGVNPIDVVQELGLPPERVTSLHRSWTALKDAQRTGPTTAERLAKLEEELKSLRDDAEQWTWDGGMGPQIDGLQLHASAIEQRLAALEQRVASIEELIRYAARIR